MKEEIQRITSNLLRPAGLECLALRGRAFAAAKAGDLRSPRTPGARAKPWTQPRGAVGGPSPPTPSPQLFDRCPAEGRRRARGRPHGARKTARRSLTARPSSARGVSGPHTTTALAPTTRGPPGAEPLRRSNPTVPPTSATARTRPSPARLCAQA
jgi:hypothetical protein